MTEAYDDGYHDITGVDIVEPVLQTMRWDERKRLVTSRLFSRKRSLFLAKT